MATGKTVTVIAVGAGLQVMQAVMEESVIEVVGEKGRHNPKRVAVRHGFEDGSVTLGGAGCGCAGRGCGPLMGRE